MVDDHKRLDYHQQCIIVVIIIIINNKSKCHSSCSLLASWPLPVHNFQDSWGPQFSKAPRPVSYMISKQIAVSISCSSVFHRFHLLFLSCSSVFYQLFISCPTVFQQGSSLSISFPSVFHHFSISSSSVFLKAPHLFQFQNCFAPGLHPRQRPRRWKPKVGATAGLLDEGWVRHTVRMVVKPWGSPRLEVVNHHG